MATITPNLPADGESAVVAPYNAMILAILGVLNGYVDQDNLKDGAITTSKFAPGAVAAALNADAATVNGWNVLPGSLSVDSGANQGQKEYIVKVNNVDVRSSVSKGMKLRFDRSVAPPTQSLSFAAASSQNASKSSPTALGVSGTATFEAWIYVNSYRSTPQTIIRQYSTNTGYGFRLMPSNQVSFFYNNAAAASTEFITHLSVPVKEWTHVAFSLTNASTQTGFMYINGVPSSGYLQSSTATAIGAVTTPIFVGSNEANAEYFDGYISELRVWSTAQSQTQIRDNMSISLAGTETGLVALYQGNGNFNDKSTKANNLTANNGASATYADNPYKTTEYGIITDINYSSPNTVLRVFTGKNHTVPNMLLGTGYFSDKNAPFGFPRSKNKWRVDLCVEYQLTTAIANVGNWFVAAPNFQIPTGEWNLGYQGTLQQASSASGARSFFAILNDVVPAATSAGGLQNRPDAMRGYVTGTATGQFSFKNDKQVGLSLPTNYYLYGLIDVATGTESWAIRGDQGGSTIYAECAYI